MKSSPSLERHAMWSVAISGAILLFLLVYPFMVRLFLPSAESVSSTSVSDIPEEPRKLGDLFDQAHERLSSPPQGVSDRGDLSAEMYRQVAGIRAIPTRKQLEQVARLRAIDMVEFGVRDATDQDSLTASTRVAMIDRSGFYGGLDVRFFVIRPTGDAQADAKAMSEGLNRPGTGQAMRVGMFNSLGIACAQKGDSAACVRLIGELGAEVAPDLPLAVAPGTTISLESANGAGSSVTWKLMNSLDRVMPEVTAGARSLQVPAEYRGQVRLRAIANAAGQSVDLDGPILTVQ